MKMPITNINGSAEKSSSFLWVTRPLLTPDPAQIIWLPKSSFIHASDLRSSDFRNKSPSRNKSPESLSSMSGSDMSSADATSCLTALEDVLPLVIQHSSISKQLGSLCSLLCTSQQTAEAVMRSCVGKLHLRAQNPAQMAWFGKHWRLVRSLRTDAGFGDAAMLRAIEDSLVDAAAR
jgi:hypothetical protein